MPSFINALLQSFGVEPPAVTKQMAARLQLLAAPGECLFVFLFVDSLIIMLTYGEEREMCISIALLLLEGRVGVFVSLIMFIRLRYWLYAVRLCVCLYAYVFSFTCLR